VIVERLKKNRETDSNVYAIRPNYPL
jgi:hypothetical protein